jgi:hypothetical protein
MKIVLICEYSAFIKNRVVGLGMVAHAYNSSYSGGRDGNIVI